MDAILQGQISRVEAALDKLIDSITSYTPSAQAAEVLVAADDDLSRGLEQLAVHQANFARLSTLKQTEDLLDNQIKSNLSLLAETRKELLKTPATTFPASARDVPFDELLAYAKRISKFTVPPATNPSHPQRDAPQEVSGDDAGQPVNGASTGEEDAAVQEVTESQYSEGKGVASLSGEQRDFLDQMSKVQFVPWPNEEVIRRGGLAQIQIMLEQGADPTSVLSPAEQAAEQQRREEAEIREKQEEEEKAEQERRRRIDGTHRATKQEQGPSGFQGLDLYDPDEE